MNRIRIYAFCCSLLFSTCTILSMYQYVVHQQVKYKEQVDPCEDPSIMRYYASERAPRFSTEYPWMILGGFDEQHEQNYQLTKHSVIELLNKYTACLEYSNEYLKRLVNEFNKVCAFFDNYLSGLGEDVSVCSNTWQEYNDRYNEVSYLRGEIVDKIKRIEQEINRRALAKDTGCRYGLKFTQDSEDLQKVKDNIHFFQGEVDRRVVEKKEGGFERKKEFLIVNIDNINKIDANGLTALAGTIFREDLLSFHLLLKLGEYVGVIMRDKKTALHVAAEVGNFHMILALAQNNANIHAQDYAGKIPLDYAYEKGNFEAFAMLLYLHKLDPLAGNYTNEIVKIFEDALKNRRNNFATLMLNFGLNSDDLNANSFLHKAIEFNDSAMVTEILNHGADVNAMQLGDGVLTPLRVACLKGNLAIVRLLLEHHANPDFEYPDGKTLIELAIEDKNVPLIKTLLSYSKLIPSIGIRDSILVQAIYSDDLELTKDMLDFGVSLDINNIFNLMLKMPEFYQGWHCPKKEIFRLIASYKGYSASHLKLKNYWQVLTRNVPYICDIKTMLNQAKNGYFGSIDSYMACGVDINCRDEQYETVLHHAVRHHNKDAIKKLLMNGADPTIKNKHGLNAVQLANDLPALYDIVPLFIDAALPARIVNQKFDDKLENISSMITNHLQKTQEFKDETASVCRSSRCFGLLVGATIECYLGAYTLFKVAQSARRLGVSDALNQNLGKVLLTACAGCLGYVGGKRLAKRILEGKKEMSCQINKLKNERSLINYQVTNIKDFLESSSTDTPDRANKKYEIRNLLVAMKKHTL